PAAVNTWYHLACTSDGTNAYFYVNGVLQASGPVDLNYTGYNGPVFIGSDNCCGGYFPGFIQDVSIWNRPLSPSEINSFVSASPVGNESGLLGCWPLQEG